MCKRMGVKINSEKKLGQDDMSLVLFCLVYVTLSEVVLPLLRRESCGREQEAKTGCGYSVQW